MRTENVALGYIYVARVPIAGAKAKGWKVGFTAKPLPRMAHLAYVARDVTLVAMWRGTVADEQCLHDRLGFARHLRGVGRGMVRGREWYRDGESFRAWLASAPAQWRGSIRFVIREGNRRGPTPAAATNALLDAIDSMGSL